MNKKKVATDVLLSELRKTKAIALNSALMSLRHDLHLGTRYASPWKKKQSKIGTLADPMPKTVKEAVGYGQLRLAAAREIARICVGASGLVGRPKKVQEEDPDVENLSFHRLSHMTREKAYATIEAALEAGKIDKKESIKLYRAVDDLRKSDPKEDAGAEALAEDELPADELDADEGEEDEPL